MAGLLDVTNDPATLGLLSLGLRLMSTPGNLGTALGQSGLGALGDVQTAQQLAMRNELGRSQLAENAQRAELIRRQIEAADQQRKIDALAPTFMRQPQPGGVDATGGIATDTMAPNNATPGGFDMQGYVARLMSEPGGMPRALALMQAMQKDETPVVIPKGGTVINRTGKVIGVGQPDLPTPTSEIQQYNLAVQQGEKRSFTDWLAAMKNAGASRVQTNINTFTPASEEAQKQFMQGVRTRYDQLQSAPALLSNIETAKKLVPQAKAFMGPFGETKLEIAKFFNNNLGTAIDARGVKSAEELRSRLFIQVMENLKKMDAQPSQYQQQVMQDAFGKLGTDPSAIPSILDVFGNIVRQKVAIHNSEVKDSIGRGVKYPYDPVIKLPVTSASNW